MLVVRVCEPDERFSDVARRSQPRQPEAEMAAHGNARAPVTATVDLAAMEMLSEATEAPVKPTHGTAARSPIASPASSPVNPKPSRLAPSGNRNRESNTSDSSRNQSRV